MIDNKTFLAATGKSLARAERMNGDWQVSHLLEKTRINCLAADPLMPRRVYAGTQEDGVLVSEDAGKTWQPAGMDGIPVKSLAVSPHHPGTIYAGCKPVSLYVSQDGGGSWKELEGLRRARRWWWFSPAEPPDWSAYVQALAIRRKAHQMGAVFGGRLPMAANFVPGGSSETVTQAKIDAFAALLTEMQTFIDDIHIPDVLAVAGVFSDYEEIGVGAGNLLSYGVFDLDDEGGARLLDRGRITDGTPGTVAPEQITEYVKHSWYTPASGGLNPGDGVTEPDVTKQGAYSFVKSPRYQDVVHEVGPLARMKVSGEYDGGVSVIDRIAARAMEAKLVAEAMVDWLGELEVDQPVYVPSDTPDDAEGIGLTEAPRGALGHWIDISDTEIARYQVITPTAWNASPLDGLDSEGVGQHGAIEQALIGTPVEDEDQPVELLRVVHSFDPCLACAVHLVRPGRKVAEAVIRI